MECAPGRRLSGGAMALSCLESCHCHVRHAAHQRLDPISPQGIVHRDLAARNCLVSDQWVVKIADLGMSRPVGGHDIFFAVPGLAPCVLMAHQPLSRKGVHATRTNGYGSGLLPQGPGL